MRKEGEAEPPATEPEAARQGSPGPEPSGEVRPPREDREPWERVQEAGEDREEEEDLLGVLPKITLGAGVILTLLVIGYLAIHGLGTLPYEPKWPTPGSDPERGRALIQRYGCGSCHRIPGIMNANGRVGPSLEDLSEQVYVGGQLTNTPDHLSEWIQDPRRFAPGTAMPDLGVTEPEARDIAAYLHRKT